ncbi:MAG: BMP family ABC transporter substrate-binding protein [Chloroflexi bacterium]|nr:BMP family ABC transporter substrate-binding protein [Chloroflexota bacterium]MCI0580670.1 BMP family ABC transporter substrate-binding protein [Chloroflexota bacterium]MCI0648686.1 BMP family ABC transporter substrate-binding protein [Chloroflexota bacterium]MCI0728094.1 BMP family ABC transporter substrate-binding protein [Chloroflexota bacterium]
MSRKRFNIMIVFVMVFSLILAACSGGQSDKVCVVLDTGGENDKSFNEFTLKGARDAAEEEGLEFAHIVSEATTDYERNIDNFITEGCGLIITVGFLMGDATAAAARANPEIKFAIVDFAYFPGAGCDAAVSDCYTEEGGLQNVTSLMFAEDEVGYLAGVLAGCMSETGKIGSVSGMEIPPVVRFVTGYQTGAKSVNPDVETFNVYIPDFNDPATGKQAGQTMIEDGADVIFGVGGNTGNGGLLAAHEAGLMAIGVDVDQFNTYPDVAASLMTSAAKNMDVAAGDAVRAFADDNLQPGIQLATVANGGVGLAPYHDWDSQIPEECKAQVEEAEEGLRAGTVDTGYEG